MASKSCTCPTCTAPIADNDDSAALIYDEETCLVHVLVNNGATDRATWDVACCGVALDIDAPHLLVKEPVPLEGWCRCCVVSFAAFLSR